MVGQARNPIVTILLMIVTCGIYYYIWIYKLSEEAKANLGDANINPGMDIILTIVTCGIYGFIWMYRQGDILKRLYEKKGLPATDEGTMFLILGIVFSPAAVYIIQDKMNKLY
ncbi:MAG: DUF4234 domain-containing protein [Leptospira sp.]|nr:DUF4234 domain-containing protein [Leptospira sp.]